jgi:D-lactate dehydrogenase (cytochrome)
MIYNNRLKMLKSLKIVKWTRFTQRFYATLEEWPGANKPLPESFLTTIQSQLPNIEINTNIYNLIRHGRGESYHPTEPPSAILYPKCTADISKILPLCKEYNVTVIPFGAGTSVEGHVCAVDRSRPTISLDMTGMNDIELSSDADGSMTYGDFFVTVGAGVTRLKLNEALR